MTIVTVYTKPSCMQCKATFRTLEKLGIDPLVIDISQDPDARDYVLSLGYLQAPVVVVDETDHWSGYRPDRLSALATTAA